MEQVFGDHEALPDHWHSVLMECMCCGNRAVHVFECGCPVQCGKCGTFNDFFPLEETDPHDVSIADVEL